MNKYPGSETVEWHWPGLLNVLASVPNFYPVSKNELNATIWGIITSTPNAGATLVQGKTDNSFTCFTQLFSWIQIYQNCSTMNANVTKSKVVLDFYIINLDFK